MNKINTTAARKNTKRSDPKVIARFVEELSWLLSSYDDLDFSAIGKEFSQNQMIRNRSAHLVSRADRPQTTIMLVGVLPSLFIDSKLFPTNEDVVEFARAAMGIDIPRWSKKSKDELIGHIVCHANTAPVEMLDELVVALERILDEKSSARKLVENQRRSGLSWNAVIQQLVRNGS